MKSPDERDPGDETQLTLDHLHLCPLCRGQGHVAKPPWVAGDIHEWCDVSTETYLCRVCKGSGTIAYNLDDKTIPF